MLHLIHEDSGYELTVSQNGNDQEHLVIAIMSGSDYQPFVLSDNERKALVIALGGKITEKEAQA